MIKYFNRKTKNYEIEKVAGEKYLNWTYSSPLGMGLLELFLKKKLFSALYGWYCDTRKSSRNVKQFIKDLDIDMSDYKQTENFRSFNEFFIRQVTPKGRPIALEENSFISPGDGRLLAYNNIDMDKLIQVKGFTYSLRQLVDNSEIAEKFKDGLYLILRLCPTDYHRFHFIDNGYCDETVKIKGHYYSVNPIALNKKPLLFCENKREWSLFHSDNFGNLLYIEVGATCVGSIIQSYTPQKQLRKGSEKGYFKFGGSTIIMFVEKGKVTLDKDILEQTALGYETKVCMGEIIGTKL